MIEPTTTPRDRRGAYQRAAVCLIALLGEHPGNEPVGSLCGSIAARLKLLVVGDLHAESRATLETVAQWQGEPYTGSQAAPVRAAIAGEVAALARLTGHQGVSDLAGALLVAWGAHVGDVTLQPLQDVVQGAQR